MTFVEDDELQSVERVPGTLYARGKRGSQGIISHHASLIYSVKLCSEKRLIVALMVSECMYRSSFARHPSSARRHVIVQPKVSV